MLQKNAKLLNIALLLLVPHLVFALGIDQSFLLGETVELKGKGYGHGFGLCQWGSRQMGIMKKNFHEILSFYYPKSILKMAQSNQLNF